MMNDPRYGAAPAAYAVDDDESAVTLVLMRVRLYARRRLMWLSRHFGAGNGVPDGRAGETARLLHDSDNVGDELRWVATSVDKDLNAQIDTVDAALAQDDVSRLARLIKIFALEADDVDVLHVCLAAAVDPSVRRLYAYLHDDASTPFPTLTLAARLFQSGRCPTWGGESPLRRWRMITVGDTPHHGIEIAPLALDPIIAAWLAGSDELDARLIGRGRLILPLEPLADWDVEGTARITARALQDDPARTVALHVIAPTGSGRRTFAANVCRQLGMPLLAVDTAAIPDHEWETAFILAQRHAFLHRCGLAWVITAETAGRRWTNEIAHFPVQVIIRDAHDPAPQIDRALDVRVMLDTPTSAERWRLWQQYAPAACAAAPNAMLDLAYRLNARPGAIAQAARLPDASPDQMAAAIRAAGRDLLGGLAQPLECPFTPDDLVVSASLRAALDDLIYEALDRGAFWEQPEARRLFPQGRGLAALFAGSPGTGKTMAAQVIAAQVGLDLFRIDLSQVVSKYVGETASNLQKILTRAAGMDVVLFFDEADALFARRTEVKDAHDRFANTDTDHLLQALENYGGIALLATNRKGNIDPAFLRRLRYVLEFPKPDADQRWQIWSRVIGALAGEQALSELGGFLRRLSADQELTGAQIKYAALSAMFAARRDGGKLTAAHVIRGLDREMAKEGRGLNERERARLESYEGA